MAVKDPEQRAMALAADRLLDQLEKIPGTQKDGKIDGLALAKWLEEVRRLCREHARSEIGDHCLGQLLAKAPKDNDGLWPRARRRGAMEGSIWGVAATILSQPWDALCGGEVVEELAWIILPAGMSRFDDIEKAGIPDGDDAARSGR